MSEEDQQPPDDDSCVEQGKPSSVPDEWRAARRKNAERWFVEKRDHLIRSEKICAPQNETNVTPIPPRLDTAVAASQFDTLTREFDAAVQPEAALADCVGLYWLDLRVNRGAEREKWKLL